MAKYTDWAALGNLEGATAPGRMAGEITSLIPSTANLSLDAKRDAALAELLAATQYPTYILAHTMNGADWGSQVQAALDLVPATGGTVDARGLVGTQSITAPLTITKPTRLLLGRIDLTANAGLAVVTANGVLIEGEGGRVSKVASTSAWSASTDFIGIDVQGVNGFVLRGLGYTLTMTGGTVATDVYALPLLIRDNVGHTVGSTNWLVEHNDFDVTGTEPATGNKMFGMLAWTRTASPPRLTRNGRISGNTVRNTEGRCIEMALCENVAVTGNTVETGGSTGTIVCVGIRVIGCRNIGVTSNAIEVTGASLANSDCLQVDGDNDSENVVFSGNTLRTSAGAGTAVKVGANAAKVTVVGNDMLYDGVATSNMYGVLVTTNPSETAPTHILVAGNRISGFNAQLGIARADVGDLFPDNVYFMGNLLGPRHDGTAAIGNFYDFSSADAVANRIVARGNLLVGTVENREERLQGDLVIPQASQFKARNVANSGDVIVAWLTSADIVQVGGTGAVEVQLTNGVDTARLLSSGHWAPASDNTQDLGTTALMWNQLYLGGDIEAAAGGFRSSVGPFTQEDVAATQTDIALAGTRWVAPRAGSVTAIVVKSTEARTAGTCTVEVWKNTGLSGAAGAGIGLTAVLDDTNTSAKATTQAKDTDTFATGDELFSAVTTSGDWTPTTADIRVFLEVEF